MPGTASRSGSDIFASLPASLRTARTGTIPARIAERFSAWLRLEVVLADFLLLPLPFFALARQAAESAAAVPEVAMTSGVRPG